MKSVVREPLTRTSMVVQPIDEVIDRFQETDDASWNSRIFVRRPTNRRPYRHTRVLAELGNLIEIYLKVM